MTRTLMLAAAALGLSVNPAFAQDYKVKDSAILIDFTGFGVTADPRALMTPCHGDRLSPDGYWYEIIDGLYACNGDAVVFDKAVIRDRISSQTTTNPQGIASSTSTNPEG